MTLYVPREERRRAWAFLNQNFRDPTTGKPKYFDYLSVREGRGEVTVTIYKKRGEVEYLLFNLFPGWYYYFDSVRGMVHQNWKRVRREKGPLGYP